MAKRVLVIDDERDLTRLFDASDDVTHVQTARAGIDRILHDHPYDEVWLDHDLGNGSGGGDPAFDTAYPVALLLAESVFHDTDVHERVGMCVIHTANPVGRTHFQLIFERFSIPFRHHYL